MTYHDLSPELQKKVKANTIAYRIKNGYTVKDSERHLNYLIECKVTLLAFFIFSDSHEGHDYWRDVINGKIK